MLQSEWSETGGESLGAREGSSGPLKKWPSVVLETAIGSLDSDSEAAESEAQSKVDCCPLLAGRVEWRREDRFHPGS